MVHIALHCVVSSPFLADVMLCACAYGPYTDGRCAGTDPGLSEVQDVPGAICGDLRCRAREPRQTASVS